MLVIPKTVMYVINKIAMYVITKIVVCGAPVSCLCTTGTLKSTGATLLIGPHVYAYIHAHFYLHVYTHVDVHV